MKNKEYTLCGLSALRARKGYTQEDLALTLGVTRQSIIKWERAKIPPTWVKLCQLLETLDCSFDDLFEVYEQQWVKKSSKVAPEQEEEIIVVEDDEPVDLLPSEVPLSREWVNDWIEMSRYPRMFARGVPPWEGPEEIPGYYYCRQSSEWARESFEYRQWFANHAQVLSDMGENDAKLMRALLKKEIQLREEKSRA